PPVRVSAGINFENVPMASCTPETAVPAKAWTHRSESKTLQGGFRFLPGLRSNILCGQPLQRALVGAVAQPFAEMLRAEPVVELARRVPVEYMEIDAAPAALDRDRGEPG